MESRFLLKKASLPIKIVVWIIAFYLAWNLIPAGYTKILQSSQWQIDFFTTAGIPLWLMVVAGVAEVFGPLLMFVPRVSFYGAVPTAIVMGVATYYNSGMTATIGMTLLALFVAVVMRPEILRKAPVITKIQA